MNGNSHQQCDCPYCWCVFYSKGSLTRHINAEHWSEKNDEELKEEEEKTNEPA